MVKFKFLHRSKATEEGHSETVTKSKTIQEPQDTVTKLEIKEQPNQTPIKEYNETLYSQGTTHKHPLSHTHQNKQPLRRTTWENTETIEQNIDTMDIKRSTSKQRVTAPETDVNKKVDYILFKKKNRV